MFCLGRILYYPTHDLLSRINLLVIIGHPANLKILSKIIKIPAASCGVFPQPLFARFRCKQRGIRPEEIEWVLSAVPMGRLHL